MRCFYVYLVTNKARTALYTGVTNSLARRMTQHRNAEAPGFTRRYNTNRLVCFERFADARIAISREKQIKGWSRKKKDALVDTQNPDWIDLGETILGLGPAPNPGWHEIPRVARDDIAGKCEPLFGLRSCREIPRVARDDDRRG